MLLSSKTITHFHYIFMKYNAVIDFHIAVKLIELDTSISVLPYFHLSLTENPDEIYMLYLWLKRYGPLDVYKYVNFIKNGII